MMTHSSQTSPPTNSNSHLKAVWTACAFLIVGTLLCSGISILTHKRKKTSIASINFGREEPAVYYAPKTQKGTGAPGEQIISNKIIGQKDSQQTTTTITSSVTTEQYKEHVHMTHVTTPNVKLYQIADEYFQVYCQNKRVSPLFPLALANVETPGRADHNITWSALFPSKVASMELADSFDVTYVAQDPITYDPLMHECSTRDRGALQMSPTYGTNNELLNSLMTGAEATKLSSTQIAPQAQAWSQGASSAPGDRFNTHDVCLRLAASATNAISQIDSKHIPVKNDAELIVMLAMYHHRSGVWQVSGAGGWRSTESCINYVHDICSQANINLLRHYYEANPATLTLDSKVALGLVGDYSKYTTSQLEASYPLRVLYSYIALTYLYGSV